MTDVLLVERTGAVATVTLNRPEAYNSLTGELKDALVAATAELAADDAVRAVVVTGAGKAFCAGQDLREHAETLASGSAEPFDTVGKHYNPITLALATMPKPVIAAVNGVAAGAGAGFAFACDFRIASEKATFLLAFANVGLSLDSGTSWTLPRIVGQARATALALLADPITAHSALEMGLVNAVVTPDHVLPAAMELAERLAAGPTAAYAAIKESIAYAATASLPDALAKEGQMQDRLASTTDHRTATDAFVAKQKPTFTGK